MSGPGGLLNPFARPDAPFAAAPALDCRCEPECARCHVDVDGTGDCFARFKEVLKAAGGLQDRGLFVVVSGPSRSGKTSLINRCAWWADRWLRDEHHVSTLDAPLTSIGQGPDVTADDRAHMVAGRLRTKVEGNQNVFDPKAYEPPRSYGVQRTLFPEDFMRAVSDAVRDRAVVIVRTPRTGLAKEVQHYWSGTSRRLLIFAETTQRALPGIPAQPQHEAHPLHLRIGHLRPGDAAEFARARLDVEGRGRTFPDLDVAAIERFAGNPPKFAIGTIQTTLYHIYDHYLHHPWPDGNMIRMADLQRYIRDNPEGPER